MKKNPSNLILDKKLESKFSSYLRKKIYLMNLENKLILEDAKNDFIREVDKNKQNIVKEIEYRTEVSQIEYATKIKRYSSLFFDFLKKLRLRK